ncbi:SDR family NAD(P)-dependent oxidoreductase [Actinobacillus vicugnae]|uniref:SDR family NAD(P)-dependent oxidoreductase n=1 Tax=Actinobacillus vicugnae TaxID=2573093 RepID=UPI00123F474A|nr:SDR family NAD(P)-dependent oxidoreductase [Actinobacillus vicugnae]
MKSFIDTVVYRSGDQIGSWGYAGLLALDLSLGNIAVLAVPLCAVWLGATLMAWQSTATTHSSRRISMKSIISRRQFLQLAGAVAISLGVGKMAMANQTGKKRILITGSASGLGLEAAQTLAKQGHSVVVHGRNPKRAEEALKAVPNAICSVFGDFADIEQVAKMAEQINALGKFDSVIHNAGILEDELVRTPQGLPRTFMVNVLAPYMLTALTQRPDRLIYITSGMQQGVSGKQALADLLWEKRRYNGNQAYSESKLFDSMLAFAVARKWQNVLSNTVDPGWVRTKMGGAYAPGSVEEGAATQIWLAGSDDKAVLVSGKSFNRMRESGTNPDAYNVDFQEELLARCEQLSGVRFPQGE